MLGDMDRLARRAREALDDDAGAEQPWVETPYPDSALASRKAPERGPGELYVDRERWSPEMARTLATEMLALLDEVPPDEVEQHAHDVAQAARALALSCLVLVDDLAAAKGQS